MEVWQDFGQRIDLAVRCALGLLPLRKHPDTLATLLHMLHVRAGCLAATNGCTQN